MTEDQLHKESAYILFYVRKDLQAKLLPDVLPHIERDFFIGKPVKMNGSDGFVIENPTRGGSNKKVNVKLKHLPSRSVVA